MKSILTLAGIVADFAVLNDKHAGLKYILAWLYFDAKLTALLFHDYSLLFCIYLVLQSVSTNFTRSGFESYLEIDK